MSNKCLHGSSPSNFKGDEKISDQNNWGGPDQKIKFCGGAKCKGGPNILGGPMNPNDVMAHSVHFGNEIWLEAQPPCRKRGVGGWGGGVHTMWLIFFYVC